MGRSERMEHGRVERQGQQAGTLCSFVRMQQQQSTDGSWIGLGKYDRFYPPTMVNKCSLILLLTVFFSLPPIIIAIICLALC